MFLQSKNLILRAMEPEDLDVLYQWENDSELWQHGTTLAPYSRFALRDYFENSLRGIFQTRQLRLMVVHKQDNKTIGTIDIYDFDPINGRAGVGILLDREYRKQGLGVEVLDMCKEYAFRFLFLNQLYAYVSVNNTPSYKLFSKCGYVQSGLLIDWVKVAEGYEDVYLMQLVKK